MKKLKGTVKIFILILTFGTASAGYSYALSINDTTLVDSKKPDQNIHYSILDGFLENFQHSESNELSFIKSRSTEINDSSLTSLFSQTSAVPAKIDINKFQKDDKLRMMEDSIQNQLFKLKRTQLIYRDYFIIPLNL